MVIGYWLIEKEIEFDYIILKPNSPTIFGGAVLCGRIKFHIQAFADESMCHSNNK